MNFHPIKYKQPTDGGDARCALYALANLFDDRAFLFFNDVGESTYHNIEVDFLNVWAKTAPAFERVPICNIYPYAITTPDILIPYSVRYDIVSEEGVYIPVLLDIAGDSEDLYHTVLALWGKDSSVVVDSKKDFPELILNTTIFEKARVHGFRVLCGGHPSKDGQIPLICLSPETLPHIFNLEL